MADEKPRRKTHRPYYDPSTNFVDIVESEPDMERRPNFLQLLDDLYDFICDRADQGDPVRWRCLIERFGDPYGHDRHAVITYAVDRLKVLRRVRIDMSRIPERIMPTREARPKRPAGDFRFGRLMA